MTNATRKNNHIGLRTCVVLIGLAMWTAVPSRSHLQSLDEAFVEVPSQTFTVTNTDTSGAGSLSQAIASANGNAGLDTIVFNIPGSGIHFFFTMATLPAITDPVVIDATTQPGYAGTPLIHIEGLGISRSLDITGGGTTIKGLSFTSNSAGASNGIVRLGGGNNIVTGCSFGVRGDSTRPLTSSMGVLIDSNGNRVGGTTAAERNYFAVTNEHQLVIQNGATNNRVTGNWFGTAPNGTRLATSGRDAIRILNSPNNTVGGSIGTTPGGACTGECNVIAGAGNNGVFINGAAAAGNRVIGNFVGLFAAGNSVNDNNLGVRIENAPGNTVGGTTPAERNIITGNSGLYGVTVTGASSTANVITGNYIGLFSSGTSAPAGGNQLDGILLNGQATGTRIGGLTPGERNVISGLTGNGIEIAASNGNSVLGNYIGTDATGMVRSTTLSNGISIQFADNNTIGGTQGTTLGGACTGVCNVISGNGLNGTGDGIVLNTSNNNTIDGCYIGLNSAGTAAMVNGRTPDGSIYNGHAIALYSSTHNTIGRVTNEQAPRDPGPEVPNTVYCIQDPKTGNFLSFSDATATYFAKHCKSGRSLSGFGYVRSSKGVVGLTSEAVTDGRVAGFVDTTRGFGRAEFPPPGAFTMYIDQDAPLNSSCECPPDGENSFVGMILFGAANEPADDNTVSHGQLGKTANGTSSLNDVFRTRSFILNLFGSRNIFEDLQIDSGEDDGVDIQNGSGNSVDEVEFETAGEAVNVAPTANGAPVPPSALVVSRFGLPDIGLHMSADVVGQASQTYEIRVWGADYVYKEGVTVPIPQLIPTAIRITVMTDLLGRANINTTFTGSEYETLMRMKYLYVTATLVATGSTSEMSAKAAVPIPLFDFDGDGKTDASVYRAGDMGGPSYWYILNSRDNSFRFVQFGDGNDVITPGYFNGDLFSDFSIFRPGNGTWYIGRPAGDPAMNFETVPWGLLTDIPVRNFDYDGDARADPTVYRPSNGTWYIRGSLGGYLYTRQWGLNTDVLAPADYDGDSRSDLAVYRAGTWFISTCPGCPPIISQWGTNGDIPVPGDFDGDGRADISVFRPSDGNWYINQSMKGLRAVHWGLPGDVPLNIDWDADGKNDFGISRPSTGDWWILQSGNGQPLGFHWGHENDIPVPKF